LSNYTPSDIAWIFTVQLALLFAPGPLFGRLADTYAPAPVFHPGAFLCIFSLCMTSLTTEFYQIFLAQGLAFGIGAGAVFTASTVCVGQWFVRRRGLAIGIVTTDSSLGGVIYPIFLNKLIQDVGLAGALRYAALLMGILLGASCFMIQARLPREMWNLNTKWFDPTLFNDKQFTLYTVGSWLVM
jgi:MFS family permease